MNAAPFIAAVGAQHVRDHDGVLTVSPANTEEFAAVLHLCAEQKLVVSPAGGGSKREWGTAVEHQVEISTLRLAGVREHSAGDLTATVGAGTPWALMEATLAEQGQRVALDPLFSATATVGGVLATNDSGSLRLRYGSLRDLVLGMTIVLADGTIARTGGKVVKNVAGYDLPKLLTGSFGTLGVITEATFRLHPVPAHTAHWTVRSTDISVLAELMQRLLTASMTIEAMQLHLESITYALDIAFAAMPEALQEHEQRLREFAGACSISAADATIWRQREQLFDDAGAMVLKITALPQKLAALAAGFAQLAQLPEHTARFVADPVGILTVAMTAPAPVLPAVVEDVRARLRASGGAVVVLRPGSLPASVDPWGDPPAAIDVMRAIKREFDPDRLLNPGKFVGGI